jgi:oxygen-independent coproporphyrinogen III oxidase
MESLGLYVSIPFCKSKCTYCNFASGVFPLSAMDRYLDRLDEDLHSIRDRAMEWGASLREIVDTVYLGGGTPSLLSSAQVERLFAALRREFVVLPNAEITVECAPGQIDDATLSAMAECGVNRISFGAQSFIDTEAKHTGRLHTREIALRDVERVRCAGIDRVNLDLIAGLPGQTPSSWRESLQVLAGANADHASIYMLEIDDDSRLGREMGSGGLKYYAPQVPPDDAIAEMYIEACAFLERYDLMQYEISNFARPESESRHNQKYWTRAPYLGFGLDAHSMLKSQSGAAMRFATSDELDSFLAGPSWKDAHTLTREEELEEAWFLGLRLNSGVSLDAFKSEFGEAALEACAPVLSELEREALIQRAGDGVALTQRGRLMSNDVFERFLLETAVS